MYIGKFAKIDENLREKGIIVSIFAQNLAREAVAHTLTSGHEPPHKAIQGNSKAVQCTVGQENS